VTEGGFRGSCGWLGQVLAWLVILGAVVVLTAAVLVPRLSGATPYTILTGSMRPHHPPGTLVVVKPIDADRIRIGDVVTYQLESGKAAVATHRVTDVIHNLGGETRFVTKGDANESPDVEQVRAVQIQGTLWYSIPYLGYASNLVTGAQRQLAVYLVATGLLGYAGCMYAAAFRDRRIPRVRAQEGRSPS
jgi:signal peptidase I